MTSVHPDEQLLADHYKHFRVLFRAPRGLLARGVTRGGRTELLRLVLPEEGERATLQAGLRGYWEALEAVSHPGVAWPKKVLGPAPLLGLVYASSPGAMTLADVVFAPEMAMAPAALVGRLVPVAEALSVLHAARLVHGAVAPVTMVHEKRGGEPGLRLFDAGLYRHLRPLEVREVLGAGPSPARSYPPNFASDVRAMGFTLLWLHSLSEERTSWLHGTQWPEAMVDLARRAVRKHPLRSSTLVRELRRIASQWDKLRRAGVVRERSPLLSTQGAFLGERVPWAAEEVEEEGGAREVEDLGGDGEVEDDAAAVAAAGQESASPTLGARPVSVETSETLSETPEDGTVPPPPPMEAPEKSRPRLLGVVRDDVVEEGAELDGEDALDDAALFSPRGEVVVTSHVLKPDRHYGEVERPWSSMRLRLTAFVLLVAALVLTVLVVQRVLQEDVPRQVAPAVAEGRHRALLPLQWGVHAEAVAVSRSATYVGYCSDNVGVVFAAEDLAPVGQFWPDGDGCVAMAFVGDGPDLTFADDEGRIYWVDVVGGEAPQLAGMLHARVRRLWHGRGVGEVLAEVLPDEGVAAWVAMGDGQVRGRFGWSAGAFSCAGGSEHFALLASGNQLVALSVADGSELRRLRASGRVLACAVSGDGRSLAALLEDGSLWQWSGPWATEPVNLRPAKALQASEASQLRLFYGAKAEQLWLVDDAQVWSLHSTTGYVEHGEECRRCKAARGPLWLLPSPRRHHLVRLDRDRIEAIDLADDVVLRPDVVQPVHVGSVFLPDGVRVFSVYNPRIQGGEERSGGHFARWDLVEGVQSAGLAFRGEAYAAAISEGGGRALVAVHEAGLHRVLLVDIDGFTLLASRTLGSRVTKLQWSLDERYFLVEMAYHGSALFFVGADGMSAQQAVLQEVDAWGRDKVVAIYRDSHILIWNGVDLRGEKLGGGRSSVAILSGREIRDWEVDGLVTHPFSRWAVLWGAGGALALHLESRHAVHLGVNAAEGAYFSGNGGRFSVGGHSFDGATARKQHFLGLGVERAALQWSGDSHFIAAWDGPGALWEAKGGEVLFARNVAPRGAKVRFFGSATAFHPSRAMVLRDRDGVLGLDAVRTLAPLFLLSSSGPGQWSVVDPQGMGRHGGAGHLAADGRGVREALVQEFSLEPLLTGLRLAATPRQDPFAGREPLHLPQTVRVQVETVPVGADVKLLQADFEATLLGQTPLSFEMESRDEALHLELSRAGYASESVALVPNTDHLVERTMIDEWTAAESSSLVIEGGVSVASFLGLVMLERMNIDRCLPNAARGLTAAAVAVEVQVTPEGLVDRVEVSHPAAAVRECLGMLMGDWRFPKGDAASVIRFVFKARRG